MSGWLQAPRRARMAAAPPSTDSADSTAAPPTDELLLTQAQSGTLSPRSFRQLLMTNRSNRATMLQVLRRRAFVTIGNDRRVYTTPLEGSSLVSDRSPLGLQRVSRAGVSDEQYASAVLRILRNIIVRSAVNLWTHEYNNSASLSLNLSYDLSNLQVKLDLLLNRTPSGAEQRVTRLTVTGDDGRGDVRQAKSALYGKWRDQMLHAPMPALPVPALPDLSQHYDFLAARVPSGRKLTISLRQNGFSGGDFLVRTLLDKLFYIRPGMENRLPVEVQLVEGAMPEIDYGSPDEEPTSEDATTFPTPVPDDLDDW